MNVKSLEQKQLKVEKTFCLLLPRLDPRTSSLTSLCITHCFNLSFCQLLLICFWLSNNLLSNFCFVSRQLYSLFMIIARTLSLFSVAFNCFSVSFQLICRISYKTFIEHVCSLKLTVFHGFIDICFVKHVSAFNWMLINIEQIWMINLYNRDNWGWKKTFCLLLPRLDPRTSSLTSLCITHCSNLSFCQLLLICFWLSNYLFSNFCFISRQLYSLFMIIVCTLSVFPVAFNCFNVSF